MTMTAYWGGAARASGRARDSALRDRYCVTKAPDLKTGRPDERERDVNVVITVDTEEDNQWRIGEIVTSTRNIKYVPRFQELCERYALKPTYLCTHGVLNADGFSLTLTRYQKEGCAEIGAHLHPWANPPFSGYSQDELCRHPFPSELPDSLFRAKLTALTDCVADRTGRRPTCYRAGRWGFCESHIPVLADLGYEIDCSVTPWVSWKQTPGARAYGPDYTEARSEPYSLDARDVCRKGTSQLLEVPVTILFTHPLMRDRDAFCRLFAGFQTTMAGRVLNRLFHVACQWFRPFPGIAADVLETVYLEACRRELPVVEMMLHSSELMPGGSPNYPDGESVERLYGVLERAFEVVAVNGGKGVTLSEFGIERRTKFAKEAPCLP